MLLLSVRAWERDSEWELECNIVIVWHKEEEEAKEAATPTRSPSPLHSYVCHEFVCMCVCVYVFLWLCDWWCQLLLIRFVSWRYWKIFFELFHFEISTKSLRANTHTHTHSSMRARKLTPTRISFSILRIQSLSSGFIILFGVKSQVLRQVALVHLSSYYDQSPRYSPKNRKLVLKQQKKKNKSSAQQFSFLKLLCLSVAIRTVISYIWDALRVCVCV